jgi:cell division transport system permease protein
MKIALVGFVLRRVRGNLRQLFWTHLLTAGTMGMTLFVFGGFMLLELNLQRLLKGWGDEIQVIAYLNGGISDANAKDLIKRVQTMPAVERVRHVSQEQAWSDFRAALGSQAGLLEGLPRDILPASIEISLKPTARDAPVIEQLAERLTQEAGIATVEYPREWVDRLALAVRTFEWLKWIFGGVLFLATFFIVGSTVKLAVLARKDEVEIMQLVGASEELIQAPFVLEGTIQGLTGAAIAILGLWALFLLIQNELPSLRGVWAPLGELQFLDIQGVVLLLVIGWLLGAFGSVISVRRFVRSWHASTAQG